MVNQEAEGQNGRQDQQQGAQFASRKGGNQLLSGLPRCGCLCQLSKAEIEGQRQQIRKANKAYRQAVRAGEIERGAYDAKIIRVNRLPKATIKRFDRIDANSDGNLDQAELTRVADFVFKRRDKDGDGFITKADLLARKK